MFPRLPALSLGHAKSELNFEINEFDENRPLFNFQLYNKLKVSKVISPRFGNNYEISINAQFKDCVHKKSNLFDIQIVSIILYYIIILFITILF